MQIKKNNPNISPNIFKMKNQLTKEMGKELTQITFEQLKTKRNKN